MADIKSIATATAPREFELSYSTTVEEVYEKLSACCSYCGYTLHEDSIKWKIKS